MFYAQGYASARSPESQEAIINMNEHSLSAHSLISAKEERWNSFQFIHEFSAKSRKKTRLRMPREEEGARGEVQIPQEIPGPAVPLPGNNAPGQPAAQQARQLTAEEKLEVNVSLVYSFLFACGFV